MKWVLSVALLLAPSIAYANLFSARQDVAIIPTADEFVSPSGADSMACGSFNSPCRTWRQAQTNLEVLIAANPAANRVVIFRGGFFWNTAITLTSADTPDTLSAAYSAAAHTTTYENYPGETPVISGGIDVSGTFASTTVNGAAACVSTYLASKAPLNGANAKYYVGQMWVNGRSAREVIWPRIGNPWRIMPGAQGTTIGANVASSTTASFTKGSPDITINNDGTADASIIPGQVGDSVGFNAASAGFSAVRPYWIVAKTSTTIRLSGAPGGAAMRARATTTATVQDPVQSINGGDRLVSAGQAGYSQFPTNGELNAGLYNYTDIKLEIAPSGASNVLIPIKSISGRNVVLNSHILDPRPNGLYAGSSYRIWNEKELLGTGGYTGEIYTDRTNGSIYYTPRSGETCGTIQAIIPSQMQILKISNAVADAGPAKTGVLVGNLNFTGLTFAHTQSSVYSGAFDVSGNIGGWIANESAHYTVGTPAIAVIGGKNVNFDGDTFTHLGEAGVAVSWGSSHSAIQNSAFSDIGAAAILSGAMLEYSNNYLYNSDADYLGTNAFGASTDDSFDDGANCCQTFDNNTITNVDNMFGGGSAVGIQLAQSFSITHNSIKTFRSFGLVIGSDGESHRPGNFAGLFAPGAFGTEVSFNDISQGNYEITLAGAPIPGSGMQDDFGLFYTRGPQDGDGARPRMQVHDNRVHDVSAGAYQMCDGRGDCAAHGKNAVNWYNDGNNSFGVDVYNNVVYNVTDPTGQGAPTWPNRITQITGNMRTHIWNNIFAGVFPASFAYGHFYGAANFFAPEDICLWQANHRFLPGSYVNNGVNLYLTKTGGMSGTAIPSCISETCPTDGTVTWIWRRTIPQPYAIIQSNIFAWTAGASADAPSISSHPVQFPQYFQYDDNAYTQVGKTLVNYERFGKSVGHATIAQWQGSPNFQDVHGVFNQDPNFVSMSAGNFNFNSTGTGTVCGGTGGVSAACGAAKPFVPWDMSSTGAR
jgi:hypothetical protein